MQWQIVAKDPDALTRFYASLFGWKVKTNNALGYREVDTQSPRGINGGVWPSPPEGHNLVQLFVEVDDVDASSTSHQLGATVIVQSELPDGDALRSFRSAGLSFGLYEREAGFGAGGSLELTAVTVTSPLPLVIALERMLRSQA